MKPSKILLDTNILLDSILQRDEFVVNARKVIRYCVSLADGYVAAHSLTNIFYVLSQSEKRPIEDCRQNIIKICQLFKICEINKENVIKAVTNIDFEDFEDSLQYACAEDVDIDVIITRNVKDFPKKQIPVLTPAEFLNLLNSDESKN